jgi:MSHA pilin protein MshD
MDQYNTKPSNASYPTTKNARGVTLVELIISMLIISIALAGVLSVMNFTTGRSADPMIQHQAIAIAEAYMEEILLQGYLDPDGDETGETRATFDDVDDYDKNNPNGEGIDDQNPPRNQKDEPMRSLQGYTVNVVVNDATLNGVNAKKITVNVSHDAMGSIDLVGYRTGY